MKGLLQTVLFLFPDVDKKPNHSKSSRIERQIMLKIRKKKLMKVF